MKPEQKRPEHKIEIDVEQVNKEARSGQIPKELSRSLDRPKQQGS